MTEIGLVEYFGLLEALGIIGTMLVVLEEANAEPICGHRNKDSQ